MSFPLSVGSRGQEVVNLQHYLNKVLARKGMPQLVTDGVFGPKTREALTSTFGHLRSNPQVSKKLYDYLMRDQAGQADQAQAQKRSGLEQMSSQELVQYIAQTDRDTYKLILATRETIARAKGSAGIGSTLAAYEQRIEQIAQGYQARAEAMNNSPSIRINRAAVSSMEWLRQKWNSMISGVPLIWPIAVGASIVVTGLIIRSTFLGHGYEAYKAQSEMGSIDHELRTLLAPEDYQRVIEMIKRENRNAYEAGRSSASLISPTTTGLAAGFLILLALRK